MKKVLLVNTNTERYPYPIPPLGLSLLASYIAPFYEVKVYDGVFDEGRSLPALVKMYGPDYIGFSIRNIDDVVADKTVFYPDGILHDFILPVKQVSDAPVIIGGSGFSVFPAEMMSLTGADYGIVGEGEEALLNLLHALDHGKPAARVCQVMTRDSEQLGRVIQREFLPYQTLPFSRIDHHIDFTAYRQRGVYSIQTKRGCALGCIYCTYPAIEGRRYRFRKPEDVAREIDEAMGRLGDVTFEFVDSTFNEPVGHAKEICRAIISRKIHPRLRTMGINPRNTGSELFDLMMEAGFTQIDVTPDSASPEVIRNLRKGFTLDDIRRTARLIRQYNLPSMWFFLFGGPGETTETVMQTRHFIEEDVSREDMVLMLSGLRIYPYTSLASIALQEGRIRQRDSLFFPSAYYFSEQTPRQELDRLLGEIRDANFNCLCASESSPAPEMIQKALAMRKEKGLTEPMFRTLLKIRKEEKQQT